MVVLNGVGFKLNSYKPSIGHDCNINSNVDPFTAIKERYRELFLCNNSKIESERISFMKKYINHNQFNELIEMRSKMNGKDGLHGLHYAVQDNHCELVKLFLDMGVDVNIVATGMRCNNSTPLLYACMQYNYDCIKLLIDVGADPLICNSKGKTPFEYVNTAFFTYIKNKDIYMKRYFTETETVVDNNTTVYTYALYKKVFNNDDGYNYIITLKLPVNAYTNIGHYNGTDPISKIKYRASALYVERIECNGESVKSVHNSRSSTHSNIKELTYTVGSIVYPDKYDHNPYNICTSGIHFFMNRESAERY